MPKNIKKLTSEWKRKIGLANKGKPKSEEHKKHLSLAWDCKKHNLPESRRKNSETQKRLYQNLEFKERVLKSQRRGLLLQPNKPETI